MFGSMPKAQLLDYQISHEADAPDSCTVEVSWVEATPGNPFFASQQPLQQVEAIDALAAKARSLGGEAFAKAQGLLQNANTALIRLGTLRVKLNDTVRQLASMAQRGILKWWTCWPIRRPSSAKSPRWSTTSPAGVLASSWKSGPACRGKPR